MTTEMSKFDLLYERCKNTPMWAAETITKLEDCNKPNQIRVMQFCPATGRAEPYLSHAEQWRIANPCEAWLFDPWSGNRRTASDVGTDVFGELLVPPQECVHGRGLTDFCEPCGRVNGGG